MKRNAAYFFILLGISLLGFTGFLYWERTSPQRLAFASSSMENNPNADNSVLPQEIIIDSLGIRLPLIPAEITTGKWSATTEGVSYLISSVLPGDVGNSIIYGHNWPNLLGKLTQIKPGDKVRIVYPDKSEKEFLVSYTITVTPDQTHVLNTSDKRLLTIYTCSGFLDSKRFVVTATLIE